jgi:hypothetical protein
MKLKSRERRSGLQAGCFNNFPSRPPKSTLFFAHYDEAKLSYFFDKLVLGSFFLCIILHHLCFFKATVVTGPFFGKKRSNSVFPCTSRLNMTGLESEGSTIALR